MLPPSPHLSVAFTTNSLTWVDVDFSSARHLVLYEITPTKAEFLDALEFHPPRPAGAAISPMTGCPGPGEAVTAGDHLATKLAGLDGIGVLFTLGLNDRVAIRVAEANTFPVVVEQRRTIDDVVSRLQGLMRRDPPLWMCRILRYPPATNSAYTTRI